MLENMPENMPDKIPKFTVSTEGDVTTVKFSDRKILEEVGIMWLGDQLNALVAEAENPKLLLDFSSVAIMSSSALSMLLTLNTLISEKGGHLSLCSIAPTIYEVFFITELCKVFTICDSRKEAMESLA